MGEQGRALFSTLTDFVVSVDRFRRPIFFRSADSLTDFCFFDAPPERNHHKKSVRKIGQRNRSAIKPPKKLVSRSAKIGQPVGENRSGRKRSHNEQPTLFGSSSRDHLATPDPGLRLAFKQPPLPCNDAAAALEMTARDCHPETIEI